MPVYLGTSGWQYRHWRETFYPKGVAQTRWLEFFAERFQTVELNNSFYHLPKPETFAKWRERTPDDFILAAKMSRYLTHIKKLKEPQEPVARFMKHASEVGDKLGPVLIQLPPTLKIDLPALEETLDEFPPGVRVAVEFRHETWWVDEVEEALTKRNVALCMADRYARPYTAVWKTADWTFLRFHEGHGRPHPCYTRKSMVPWAERLAEMWGPEADIYVYFNNDPRACAIRDVIVFSELLHDVGLSPTRVPKMSEVTLAKPGEAAW